MSAVRTLLAWTETVIHAVLSLRISERALYTDRLGCTPGIHRDAESVSF